MKTIAVKSKTFVFHTNSLFASVFEKKILYDMGLDNCSQNIIGDQNLRGVSGGEKRRCTISNEAGDPTNGLDILDLPTNGLDSV